MTGRNPIDFEANYITCHTRRQATVTGDSGVKDFRPNGAEDDSPGQSEAAPWVMVVLLVRPERAVESLGPMRCLAQPSTAPVGRNNDGA